LVWLTYFTDAGGADDETEVLTRDWSNDLEENGDVVQYISKQPVCHITDTALLQHIHSTYDCDTIQ